MSTTFIFDIGNVVWNYKPLLDQLLNRWATTNQLPYEEFYTHYLSFYKNFETNKKTIDDFVEYLYLTDSKPFYLALDQTYTLENFNTYLNIPLLNLIKNIRQLNKVGFLSNGENFFKKYIYDRIYSNFDFGYTSFDLGLEKPNPEIYLKVLQLQNLKPAEVVFIDDTQKNIDAASSLGIKSILFESNTQFLADLQKLDIRN